MTTAFTSYGKQVKHRGRHFADAADESCAALIARTLNRALQAPGTQPDSGAGPDPAEGGSAPCRCSHDRSAQEDSSHG